MGNDLVTSGFAFGGGGGVLHVTRTAHIEVPKLKKKTIFVSI